ncbi:hypothetical protein B10525_14490 [Campylobacter jejuni]|nr:hypothetical protein B10525_14490 [Campylobacter jejuni]
MPFRADDNAEHLYRYVMKNYPEKNIAFVLRKNSHDYKRLKKKVLNWLIQKVLNLNIWFLRLINSFHRILRGIF